MPVIPKPKKSYSDALIAHIFDVVSVMTSCQLNLFVVIFLICPQVIPKPKKSYSYGASLEPDVWLEPLHVWEVGVACQPLCLCGK